jgi:hypothetical protein
MDVLAKLAAGELRMCDAPGCANTWKPDPARGGGRRYCHRDDCAVHRRTCVAPWCSNTFTALTSQQYCQDPDCQDRRREAKLNKTVRLRGPAAAVVRQVIAQTLEMPQQRPDGNALARKVRAVSAARGETRADRVVALTDLAATAVLLAAIEGGTTT